MKAQFCIKCNENHIVMICDDNTGYCAECIEILGLGHDHDLESDFTDAEISEYADSTSPYFMAH